MKASEEGHLALVAALLNHGASVDEKDKVRKVKADDVIGMSSVKVWCDELFSLE
jgi:hypothetical protein